MIWVNVFNPIFSSDRLPKQLHLIFFESFIEYKVTQVNATHNINKVDKPMYCVCLKTSDITINNSRSGTPKDINAANFLKTPNSSSVSLNELKLRSFETPLIVNMTIKKVIRNKLKSNLQYPPYKVFIFLIVIIRHI